MQRDAARAQPPLARCPHYMQESHLRDIAEYMSGWELVKSGEQDFV